MSRQTSVQPGADEPAGPYGKSEHHQLGPKLGGEVAGPELTVDHALHAVRVEESAALGGPLEKLHSVCFAPEELFDMGAKTAPLVRVLAVLGSGFEGHDVDGFMDAYGVADQEGSWADEARKLLGRWEKYRVRELGGLDRRFTRVNVIRQAM
jgi:hypothetical protein